MKRTAYIPIQHDADDWTYDTPLFVGKFPYYRNEERMVQGKLNVSSERYSRVHQEIVPIASPDKGNRTYILMRPYILEPEVFVTVGMYKNPKRYADQDSAIGEVLSSNVKGMRQFDIGNAQAYFYPEDKLILIWECFLESDFRSHPFKDDLYMGKLWLAFEQWLIKQFPQATRIATPFNDPIAQTIEEYQEFLRSLGYGPVAQAAFGKPIRK